MSQRLKPEDAGLKKDFFDLFPGFRLWSCFFGHGVMRTYQPEVSKDHDSYLLVDGMCTLAWNWVKIQLSSKILAIERPPSRFSWRVSIPNWLVFEVCKQLLGYCMASDSGDWSEFTSHGHVGNDQLQVRILPLGFARSPNNMAEFTFLSSRNEEHFSISNFGSLKVQAAPSFVFPEADEVLTAIS